MPRKCFVVNCTPQKRFECKGLFSIPKNPELRKKWLEVIPERERHLLPGDKICIEHFCQDDLLQESRIAINDTVHVFERGKQMLKPGAVPSIFPPSVAIGSSCKLPLLDVIKDTKQPLNIEDSLQTLDDLKSQARTVKMPSPSWGLHLTEHSVAFSCFSEESYDKGVFSEKGVVFQSVLMPQIIIRGRIINTHLPGLKRSKVRSIGDVEVVLKEFDVARTCKGYNTKPYGLIFSPNCDGLLTFSQKNRCKNCSF